MPLPSTKIYYVLFKDTSGAHVQSVCLTDKTVLCLEVPSDLDIVPYLNSVFSDYWVSYHLNKPAWHFPDGEVHAKHKTLLPSHNHPLLDIEGLLPEAIESTARSSIAVPPPYSGPSAGEKPRG